MRFNCLNGHNFYLNEDQINKTNLDKIKKSFRQARKDLKAFQFMKMRDLKNQDKSSSYQQSKPHSQDSDCIKQKAYTDDVWCNKCYDYYNQCSMIAAQCRDRL